MCTQAEVGDGSCPWTWTFECWTVIGPWVLTRDLPCHIYLRSSQPYGGRRLSTDHRLDQNRFLSNFQNSHACRNARNQVACPSLPSPTTTMSALDLDWMSDSDLDSTSDSDLDSLYNLRAKYSRFRILVIGRANAGKMTLLQKSATQPRILVYMTRMIRIWRVFHRAGYEVSF